MFDRSARKTLIFHVGDNSDGTDKATSSSKMIKLNDKANNTSGTDIGIQKQIKAAHNGPNCTNC